MSLSEADWLDQIASDRDNDALRLMFADWLEEHDGAARAEFIRVQIRLAALSQYAPEHAALKDREGALLAKHRKDWLTKMPTTLRDRCSFERGFVTYLDCPAALWLRNAERIHQAYPMLECLLLSGIRRDRTEELAACPCKGSHPRQERWSGFASQARFHGLH
jgi:uncharacterized protein (TIGR02996 family)